MCTDSFRVNGNIEIEEASVTQSLIKTQIIINSTDEEAKDNNLTIEDKSSEKLRIEELERKVKLL